MKKKIAAVVVAVGTAAAAVVGFADREGCASRLLGMPRGVCQRMVDGKPTDPKHGEIFPLEEAVGACHPVTCLSGELVAIEQPARDAGAR